MTKPTANKDQAINKFIELPPNTELEVFCFRGDEIVKVTMTFEQSKSFDQKAGWRYVFSQKGFNETIPTKTLNYEPTKK